SPVAATDRAARRATIVLDEMVRIHAITPAQREQAFATKVRVNPVLANQRAQYFTDWVDDQVRQLVGEPTEDLVVETTLDLPLQASAEQAVQAGVAGAKAQGVQQAALVSLDGEGRIRAYVGGINYLQSQFDRVTQARRQAGSSFKPFVYLTAMEAGRTPDTPVVDEPITIGKWTPRNYTGKYLGPITLEIGLKESINTVAARLANEVGSGDGAAARHLLPHPGRSLHGPGRRRGEPAGDGPGLRALLQRRGVRQGLRHRAHPHRHRPGALRPRRGPRPAARGDQPAGALLHGPYDAPGDRLRHRHAGGGEGLRPGRKDRHHKRLPRRLVHRLHRRLHHRSLGRQG